MQRKAAPSAACKKIPLFLQETTALLPLFFLFVGRELPGPERVGPGCVNGRRAARP
ncbi:hypothetical protein DWUX_2090 [Desulfovibrio diazotrophicus]|nr:hypothetical protein DWUX_2090 [Desulfovibrio diazotrophicus]